MRRHRAPLVIVTCVAILALAACGATAAPSGGIRTTACNGLATINSVLDSLSNIKSNTTVGEVKAAQQKVTTALNVLDKLQARIPAASGDVLSQIRSANEQLAEHLQPYPDDTPIGQTSAQIQDLKATVVTLQGQITLLSSILQCPS